MRRIIINGGSFNPLHDGHIHTADEGHKALGLKDQDEVWMWVSHNPFKDASVYAPLDLREAMCEERTQDRPWLKVKSFESVFHDTKTASSLSTLREMYPETQFIWMFGDDNFTQFHTWDDERFKIDGEIVPDWQYILHNFSVAVMHRPGYREESMDSIAASYGSRLYIQDPKTMSVAQIGWSFIDNATMDQSSTDIRTALLNGTSPIPGLTPFQEELIKTEKLYGVNAEFTNAATRLPFADNNDVRMDAFLLLANTINLVKTLSAYNLPGTSFHAFKEHFEVCWDKSSAKGKFKAYDAVPSEIADCMISLSGIAKLQREELDFQSAEQQTPHSIATWCDEHFPDRDLNKHLLDYIEELAELCVCEGLEKHRALKIIELIFEAPDLADPKTALQTNLSLLEEYAQNIEQSLSAVLDAKMQINKERSPAQPAASAAKRTNPIRGLVNE